MLAGCLLAATRGLARPSVRLCGDERASQSGSLIVRVACECVCLSANECVLARSVIRTHKAASFPR